MNSQLILRRFEFTDASTIGELHIDMGFTCNTLEDTCRRDINNDGKLNANEKVFGLTAIPCGIYEVVLTNSPKFGFVPHLLNVPLFTDILIHNGNAPIDTHGCILVGQYDKAAANWIGHSRSTLKTLMEILVPLSQKESLSIEIIGGLNADQT